MNAPLKSSLIRFVVSRRRTGPSRARFRTIALKLLIRCLLVRASGGLSCIRVCFTCTFAAVRSWWMYLLCMLWWSASHFPNVLRECVSTSLSDCADPELLSGLFSGSINQLLANSSTHSDHREQLYSFDLDTHSICKFGEVDGSTSNFIQWSDTPISAKAFIHVIADETVWRSRQRLDNNLWRQAYTCIHIKVRKSVIHKAEAIVEAFNLPRYTVGTYATARALNLRLSLAQANAVSSYPSHRRHLVQYMTMRRSSILAPAFRSVTRSKWTKPGINRICEIAITYNATLNSLTMLFRKTSVLRLAERALPHVESMNNDSNTWYVHRDEIPKSQLRARGITTSPLGRQQKPLRSLVSRIWDVGHRSWNFTRSIAWLCLRCHNP